MASPTDTERLPEAVARLLDPAAHGEPGLESVRLRETHISWLLFTGRRVYKVKKPVDFGFLDFTTRELRRRACHEETRLNRRLSPRVYPGVVAICGGASGTQLRRIEPDDPEPRDVLDYAVEMVRLADGEWLADLLAQGRATRQLVHRIAHRLVGFHARAERSPEITREGALESVARNVNENFEQTGPFVGEVLPRALWDMSRAYALAFLRQREALFRRREREGRICDGHGDLHAAQIHVGNGIDFIDCIEFNRRFRCLDVAADLAFTSMDLDFAERPDLADALVLEYMARTGDTGLLGVLTFYECYRAFTRGKVESMRLAQQSPVAGRDDSVRHARRYFELAAAYARPRRPVLLMTTGLMGSGKSTLAAGLAERLDALVLSSDPLRKELAGLEPEAPAPARWGEGIYDRASTDRTYDVMLERGLEGLHRGRHVILDASFARREHRDRVREAAAADGFRCLTLAAVVDERVQRRRLEQRVAGAAVSDGRPELVEAQRVDYAPPDEVPERERIVVDTDEAPERVAGTALMRLMERLLAPTE